MICEICQEYYEDGHFELSCVESLSIRGNMEIGGYHPKECEDCGETYNPTEEVHLCPQKYVRSSSGATPEQIATARKKLDELLKSRNKYCPVCGRGKKIMSKETRKDVATIAARILRSNKYSAEVKKVAASALAQVEKEKLPIGVEISAEDVLAKAEEIYENN